MEQNTLNFQSAGDCSTAAKTTTAAGGITWTNLTATCYPPVAEAKVGDVVQLSPARGQDQPMRGETFRFVSETSRRTLILRVRRIAEAHTSRYDRSPRVRCYHAIVKKIID